MDIKTIKNIKKYNGKSGYYTFNDENPLNANRVNEEAGVKFYYSSEFLHNKSIVPAISRSSSQMRHSVRYGWIWFTRIKF